MSFTGSRRYVPHSETTRTYYEQLLLDLRRCLPPGVDDDVEDIAEEALAIICVGGATNAGVTAEAVHQQQQALERLLDTPLKREARDHLLRYGRLLTDYVAATATTAATRTTAGSGDHGNEEGEGDWAGQNNSSSDRRGPRGVFDLDEAGASGSSSSSSSDDDDDGGLGVDLITGLPRKKRTGDAEKKRRALRKDKSLAHFAFSGEADDNDGEGDNSSNNSTVGGANHDDMFASDGFNDGAAEWGAAALADGDFGGGGDASAPKITFDEVACNPQYVKDTLRRLFPAHTVEACEAQAVRVVDFLAQRTIDELTLETQLTAFLGGYDNEEVMDWIGDVCGSRWGVVYGLRYAACSTQKEKIAAMDAMREHAREDGAVERLYQSITGKEVDVARPAGGGGHDEEAGCGGIGGDEARQPPLRRVDLQACAFQNERAPHRYVRATVPHGTKKATYETHDEVILPPGASAKKSDPLVPIADFPEWCHGAFAGVASLNPMQSRTFDCAFHSDENMLVSAPTGAGKTNVAMMAMLRAVQNAMAYASSSSGSSGGAIDLRALKMVYVAPMKALVQEVVRTFSARLEPLGLTVAELSGDSAMTQQQMADTQLIVTTPEKWDIVTRKSVELGVASLLKLLIIDEAHLLHNERGPVLEAIVARTMIQQQLRGAGGIRLVALSATLPNYEDVASFLQVDRRRGLFVFDSTYRPIPLEQTFCAVKRVKGVNQAAVMNRVAYDKVLQSVQDNEQTMIFVHSRKETKYTARYLQKRATEERHSNYFVRPGGESERALQDAVNSPTSGLRLSLQQLLSGGFAMHHAGLSRDERQTVEELFAERHVKVLVCTSTLAWGVNLPANRVIIKGTRVFNGAKGESELLSALDVLQMFGRAGRFGFGVSIGRAAIITSSEDLHYYLCVLNQQLPIESQMMKRVVDMLNAEVSLGHIETTKEGVRWLQRTYWYVRMRKVPEVYGVRPSASDPLLLRHLENIVHTACEELKACRMVEYEPSSSSSSLSSRRAVCTTPYGRIAAHCYVSATSMAVYLAHLSNAMQDVDLFRVFAMSSEFTNITVRIEEQAQLRELQDSAPVAVRESRYTPLAKINLLLQCFISRKDLEGLPLMSEVVYIKDSAQRILRALYEICLVREFGRTARQFLQLYAMVLHRQWAVESPVRQVREVLAPKNFEAILPVLERVRVPWEELRRWSVEDLADRLGDDRRAGMAHECVAHVPHVRLEAAVRPLARNMLYVDVDISPDFTYSETMHGRSVCELLLLVEAPNCRIIHCETLHVPLRYFESGETFACPPTVVPMISPKPTHLFVRVVSPNWLGCEATAAVCLLNMPLPAIAPPLLEVDHVRAERGGDGDDGDENDVAAVMGRYKLGPVSEKIFPFDHFLASQRALIAPIFDHSNDSVFAGIPPGGGKTVVSELFILQFLLECALNAGEEEDDNNKAKEAEAKRPKKVLYITSNEDTAARRFMDWRYTFGEQLGLGVARLDGALSVAAQHGAVAAASVVVASGAALLPWVRAGPPLLQDVTHIVADHLHLLRAAEGRAVEECLARLQSPPFLVRGGLGRARLLALSYPLISCTELGRWLKVPAARQFNLGASFRQLRVRVSGLELPGPRSRYETSVVAAMKLLQRAPYCATPCVVFVPYAREAEEVARRLLLRCRDFVPGQTAGDKNDDDDEEEESGSARAAALAPSPTSAAVDTDDPRLAILLSAGVAYLHRGTTTHDVLTVIGQVERPAAHPHTRADLPLILVCAFDAAWRLPAALFSTAFVCSAERLSATPEDASKTASTTSTTVATVQQLDCGASELLQMVSRAANEAVVFSRVSRQWVWTRLLNDPLPLESNLRYPEDFCDVVNAAVAERRATTVIDVLRVLQSHYFLHHVRSNLPFYGLTDAGDIALYASDFARRIVAELRGEGCIEVGAGGSSGGGNPRRIIAAAGGGGENEEDAGTHHHEDSNEEEEDPHALVRPTPRGAAIAHHCVTLDSVRRVNAAVAAAAATRVQLSATDLWQTLADACEELAPARLGDAARITEAAEYRALHTIARALPAEKFGLSYIDLNFTKSSTKVFLLVLAHCARFFPAAHTAVDNGGDDGSGGGDDDDAKGAGLFDREGDYHDLDDSAAVEARRRHPFYRAAAATRGDAALLCALPATLVARLQDDLATVLPAAAHLVSAMVELLDPTQLTGAAGAARPAYMSRAALASTLMRISQCLQRRTWVGESPLLQLPALQALQPPPAALEAAKLDLAAMQTSSSGAPAVTEAAVRALLAATAEAEEGRGDDDGSKRGRQRLADQTAFLRGHLGAEAAAVPCVTGLAATGGVDEAAAAAGVVALAVTVTATIAWTAGGNSSSSGSGSSSAEEAVVEVSRRWWITCLCRRKAGGNSSGAAGARPPRILAMRVSSAEPTAADGMAWALTGKLLFPLATLEAEGDLDAVDVVVSVTSEAFRAESEAVVTF